MITLKKLNVMGVECEANAAKMYAVVNVRPANLKTDQGVYVKFAEVATTTDDYAKALSSVRMRRTRLGGSPGVSVLLVRIEDSVVIL